MYHIRAVQSMASDNLSVGWQKNTLNRLDYVRISAVQLDRCAMPSVMFTTALAIDTQSATFGGAGLLTWFWSQPNYDEQLRGLRRTATTDAKKFIDLLTKRQASLFYCKDSEPSCWESYLLSYWEYPIILAYIALAKDGGELPTRFDGSQKWQGPPNTDSNTFLKEYEQHQANRHPQDAALGDLPNTPNRIETYVEHAHYWLNLAKAVIASGVYQTYHYVMHSHIAAYFFHQAVKYYQHALYLDQQDKLPSSTDKAAWAKPLGKFLNGTTRVYIRQQLDNRWLKDYMTCLKELAPRDIAFHLDKLLAKEEPLFAKKLTDIKADTGASSAPESDADSQDNDGKPLPADTPPQSTCTNRKH